MEKIKNPLCVFLGKSKVISPFVSKKKERNKSINKSKKSD